MVNNKFYGDGDDDKGGQQEPAPDPWKDEEHAHYLTDNMKFKDSDDEGEGSGQGGK